MDNFKNNKRHYCDCAVYNEPAYPAGECDCSWDKDHPVIAEHVMSNTELNEAINTACRHSDVSKEMRIHLNKLLEIQLQRAQMPITKDTSSIVMPLCNVVGDLRLKNETK